MRYLLAIIVIGGCRTLAPTPATVAGYERVNNEDGFRHCTVMFGWTKDELESACGKPIKWLRNVRSSQPGAECGIYPSDARTFVAGAGSAYLAVCMEPQRQNPNTSKAWPALVGAVYGLAQPPPSTPPATSSLQTQADGAP